MLASGRRNIQSHVDQPLGCHAVSGAQRISAADFFVKLYGEDFHAIFLEGLGQSLQTTAAHFIGFRRKFAISLAQAN